MSTPGSVMPLDDTSDQELFARWKWTALIVGFIAIQFLMSGVAIFLATSDPTHAVVPNYHQQAMEYDKVLAARQASHRLGWKWTITPAEYINSSGKRLLTVELSDARAKPLNAVDITLQLCHHARGNQRQNLHLIADPDKPGVYRGEAFLDRSGLWQVDLVATRQGDVFIDRRENLWSLAKR